MSRPFKVGMTFCGEMFAATLELPDKYFDEKGYPLYHLINNRLGAAPTITYNPIIREETLRGGQ